MRNFQIVVRAFLGAAVVTSLVACEEVEPPRPQRTQLGSPVAAPPPAPRPEAHVTPPAPPAPAPAPPAPAPAPPQPAVAVEDGKTDQILAAARASLAAGDLGRASTLARLATKKAPNRAAAWNTLGRVQLKRGARKDAIAAFGRAVELNPSSSYAQNNLGLALLYDGKYDEAVDALEEATQLEPVEGYMWNNLGMAYEHLDRLDEARDAYRQAIELEGERGRANLARLEGVRSIKTAKADGVQSDVTPVDEAGRDGGVE